MLRFFRINDPYRLVIIFVILVGIRLVQAYFIGGQSEMELKWLLLGEWLGNGFSMYSETYDYTGPVAAFVYKYVDILFGRNATAHHVLSSLLIILQAGLFNQILLKNKAFNENSYLPAFLYVLLAVYIPDFMTLSPQLMSMTFILITMGNVLRRIDNQATDELFLNSGIYVGIASMIYLPTVVFLFVFLFSLIIFSSAVTRRLLLYLFGYLLVVFMCITFFYWKGDLNYFLNFFLSKGLTLKATRLVSMQQLIIILAPLLFVLLLAVFRAISSARLTNFQQRVQQVIWFIFLGGIACFLLSKRKEPADLIFAVPLLAYFLNHYFILLTNRIFKFVMPGFIVFGLLFFSIYIYQNTLAEQTIAKQPVSDEKILVLGEDLLVYAARHAASPCFSEVLSREAFSGLDYYQSSSKIYEWMDRLDPDAISDEMEVIPQLFHRFPLLEEKYLMVEPNEYIRVSN